MREPSEVGTIVLLSNGEALLLVKATWPSGWWNLTRKVWQEWSAVSDLVPSIVRHGYTPPPPPTPEPTLPYAVVRDAEGGVMVKRDGDWLHLPSDASLPWRDLVQPVEIIFAGVPDA
jgi:hypothetical protein